ncbi:unnamed protein product [Periconia digitata]|uniref:Uncharacterized protein n=1 Tax=Periconia digitata TaxID=1303443 RepID=A0A9W4XL85_9PLEO|nr:unnamed protein product [Periconia digitata]
MADLNTIRTIRRPNGWRHVFSDTAASNVQHRGGTKGRCVCCAEELTDPSVHVARSPPLAPVRSTAGIGHDASRSRMKPATKTQRGRRAPHEGRFVAEIDFRPRSTM